MTDRSIACAKSGIPPSNLQRELERSHANQMPQPSRLSLYMAVTGGNDWSVYYEDSFGFACRLSRREGLWG